MSSPPAVRAAWTIGRQWAVRCPYCKDRHVIEPRPGHRAVFCHMSKNPLPLLVLPPVEVAKQEAPGC